VGWGPYVIEEWIPGDNITLRKNENYFRAKEGLPRFEKLVFRFVGDNVNAMIAGLISRECHVISRVGLAAAQEGQSELLLELGASGDINAHFVIGTTWEHVDFGILPASYDDGWQPGDRPDFFGEVPTRRAFALCMDRQRMMETAAHGQSFVPDTYLPPQHPLHNPDVAHYDFDIAAGSALLEEVGWVMGDDGVRVFAGEHPRIPPGTRLSLRHESLRFVSQEAVQIMVDSLAQCGIEVNVAYWDAGELFAGGPEAPVFGRNFDLTQFRWLTGASPPCELWLSEQIPGEDTNIFPQGWAGQNNPGFSDSEYDRVCKAALQSLPGQPGYMENHLKAQEIFAEQLPVVLLHFHLNFGATRPDFCGYIIDPSENVDTWNIEAFDYGPDC
jgi:peptide/nickel transport system substrate-binding protein